MYAENDCDFDVIHILFGCHVCVWNVDNVELDQPGSYGGVGRWHILLCANRRWKRLAVRYGGMKNETGIYYLGRRRAGNPV